jgi:hypothetical protein
LLNKVTKQKIDSKKFMKTKEYLSKPQAISKDIVVQNLRDEVLVYNLITHQAMSLNRTITTIWQLCDGKKDVSEIRHSTAKILNTAVSDEVVFLALDELSKNGLLDTNELIPLKDLSQINRREMIKNIALTTSVAIPIITSLVAPKAINAASGGCLTNTDCQSNCCFTNVCTQFNAGGAANGGGCFVDADCQSNCCDTGICSPACGVCFI